MKSTENFKKTIEDHLRELASKDQLFAETLKKEKKNIDEVNEGTAVLIIRTWSGKPYKDPQIDVKTLGKGECGIQKCQVLSDSEFVFVDGELHYELDRFSIEKNDGLTSSDFWNWFNEDVHDGCIIHFTNKKY